MKLDVRKSSAAVAAVATAGVSSVFLGATPAMAASDDPCLGGEIVGPGICEIAYTDAAVATFTPTAQMTQLEILLVGGGGTGADQTAPNTNGYAGAGGGGAVVLVDFDGATDPIEIGVAAAGASSYAAEGSNPAIFAQGGQGALPNGGTGGASGNGNLGGSTGTYSAGGGAGGAVSNSTPANGGVGAIVDDLAAAGSLFDGDLRCFGGGGAVGTATVQGIPGCDAGGPADATGTTLALPVPNSGGGGGGLTVTQPEESRLGATGVAIVRFTAAPVTVTFDVQGKGTAPAAQEVLAGYPITKPADPTASGYTFTGWFADAALTTPVDFSAAVVEDATYYAGWTPALAATGSTPDAAVLPIGLGVLVAGAGLMVAATARKRRES
ncbi:InlB B-repeat-containing protein [Schumannella luteola]